MESIRVLHSLLCLVTYNFTTGNFFAFFTELYDAALSNSIPATWFDHCNWKQTVQLKAIRATWHNSWIIMQPVGVWPGVLFGLCATYLLIWLWTTTSWWTFLLEAVMFFSSYIFPKPGGTWHWIPISMRVYLILKSENHTFQCGAGLRAAQGWLSMR